MRVSALWKPLLTRGLLLDRGGCNVIVISCQLRGFSCAHTSQEGLVGSKKFAQMFVPNGVGLKKFGKPVAAIVADEANFSKYVIGKWLKL